MSKKDDIRISSENLFSIIYHDIFEYPLTTLELVKWQPGKEFKNKDQNFPFPISYQYNNGYFFLKGKNGLVLKRVLRKKISFNKLKIARQVAKDLKIIPFIKTIAVTGSLSMLNAKKTSDIDLMIIVSKGGIWTARILSFLLLKLKGVKVRRFRDKNEKDKICMNMWFDESKLVWPKNDRNFYTAHEILQILPLEDKGKTFRKFLSKNNWVEDYWPNVVKIGSFKKNKRGKKECFFQTLLGRSIEHIFFNFQKFYMRKKRTREIIKKDRAIFHPIDRYKVVKRNLEVFNQETYINK